MIGLAIAGETNLQVSDYELKRPAPSYTLETVRHFQSEYGEGSALYWLVGALRQVGGPLQTAWFNLQIDDPQVRATTFSASGQADAIGQVLGGPAVGAIGNVSIRAALVASALLLSPVIPLYAWAMRRGEPEMDIRD